MKYYIYLYNQKKQGPDKESGYFGTVESAENELLALKKFYVTYLNLYSTTYLKNQSLFVAEKMINLNK